MFVELKVKHNLITIVYTLSTLKSTFKDESLNSERHVIKGYRVV